MELLLPKSDYETNACIAAIGTPHYNKWSYVGNAKRSTVQISHFQHAGGTEKFWTCPKMVSDIESLIKLAKRWYFQVSIL